MLLESQFTRADLNDFLLLVSRCATKRWPNPSYLMTSDVAWRLPFSAPKENIKLWKDDQGLLAFAWFAPNDTLVFDIRDDRIEDADHLLERIISWASGRAEQLPAMNPWLLNLNSMTEWEEALSAGKHLQASETKLLFASAFDRDTARIDFLIAHGFDATEHTARHLARTFSGQQPEAPGIDPGNETVFRHVKEDELELRCELHRNAWLNSTFSIEQYQRIRSMPIYEPELDIVSVDRQGNFGSYCIGWVDREMAVGSFEPVGTHKDYRHRGLAEQVIRETLRRMQALGMKGAKISTAGFNDPAFSLYQRCGFEFTDFERTYVKPIS
jgi:ribosomal protein S18 acetylase RimI-like enzyme